MWLWWHVRLIKQPFPPIVTLPSELQLRLMCRSQMTYICLIKCAFPPACCDPVLPALWWVAQTLPDAPLATWTCTCDGVNPPLLLLDMFDPPEMLSVFHQQTIRHVSVRLIALVWREGCRGIKVNHCTLRFVVKPTNFPLIGSCNEVQVVTWPLRQSLKMFLVSTSVLPAHTSWRSTSESHFSSKWI